MQSRKTKTISKTVLKPTYGKEWNDETNVFTIIGFISTPVTDQRNEELPLIEDFDTGNTTPISLFNNIIFIILTLKTVINVHLYIKNPSPNLLIINLQLFVKPHSFSWCVIVVDLFGWIMDKCKPQGSLAVGRSWR